MGQTSTQNLKDLRHLRDALIHLHKAILDFETKLYQRANKHRPSAGELYLLVLDHPNFAWLRQLSEVIVAIDELLDKKEIKNSRQMDDLVRYLKRLLKASKVGNKFEREYFKAIQKEPAVALAHARVIKMLD